MRNDRKIEALIKRLSEECKIWQNYTRTFNFNTVSDRMIEKIIATANQIETLHKNNFKEAI